MEKAQILALTNTMHGKYQDKKTRRNAQNTCKTPIISVKMTYTLGYVFVFLANLGSEDCDHHHRNDYQCIKVIVAKIRAILPPASESA